MPRTNEKPLAEIIEQKPGKVFPIKIKVPKEKKLKSTPEIKKVKSIIIK